MQAWQSVLGLFVMMFLAWLLSPIKSRIPWRIIIGGLLLQFSFALVLLRFPPGREVFNRVNSVMVQVLNCVDAGASFVFGAGFEEHFFAFKVLSVIIFFAALMNVLYYIGLLQLVVRGLGWVMQRTLGTSGAESLAAAANVFIGHTEAPLVVKPYLNAMTHSELMAMMVGGLATVSGSVMAAFIAMGINGGHLLTASLISAPAALMIAKIMQPETEVPQTTGQTHVEMKSDAVNVLDAMTTGASDGLKLALNVGAMIIAFLAMIALVDLILGSIGGLFDQTWSLAAGLGHAFAPFAWLMGVPTTETYQIGQLLGLKTVANEFIAFEKLAEMKNLSERSQIIATYALCGFANLGSIGVQIGGIGLLAPDRKSELARLGLRAMIGGTLAAFMTACVANILLPA